MRNSTTSLNSWPFCPAFSWSYSRKCLANIFKSAASANVWQSEIKMQDRLKPGTHRTLGSNSIYHELGVGTVLDVYSNVVGTSSCDARYKNISMRITKPWSKRNFWMLFQDRKGFTYESWPPLNCRYSVMSCPNPWVRNFQFSFVCCSCQVVNVSTFEFHKIRRFQKTILLKQFFWNRWKW